MFDDVFISYLGSPFTIDSSTVKQFQNCMFHLEEYNTVKEVVVTYSNFNNLINYVFSQIYPSVLERFWCILVTVYFKINNCGNLFINETVWNRYHRFQANEVRWKLSTVLQKKWLKIFLRLFIFLLFEIGLSSQQSSR